MKMPSVLKWLLIFTIITSCFNQEKTNRFHSRSIEESKQNGLFFGFYSLTPNIETCFDSLSFICWAENGAWIFDSPPLSISQRQKIDFNNLFLKINNDTKIKSVKYRVSKLGKWEPSSKFIEPDLGYYFQIDKKTTIDSIKIRIETFKEICIYYLTPIEQ